MIRRRVERNPTQKWAMMVNVVRQPCVKLFQSRHDGICRFYGLGAKVFGFPSVAAGKTFRSFA